MAGEDRAVLEEKLREYTEELSRTRSPESVRELQLDKVAIAQVTNKVLSLHVKTGAVCYKLGDYDRAVEILKKLTLCPDFFSYAGAYYFASALSQNGKADVELDSLIASLGTLGRVEELSGGFGVARYREIEHEDDEVIGGWRCAQEETERVLKQTKFWKSLPDAVVFDEGNPRASWDWRTKFREGFLLEMYFVEAYSAREALFLAYHPVGKEADGFTLEGIPFMICNKDEMPPGLLLVGNTLNLSNTGLFPDGMMRAYWIKELNFLRGKASEPKRASIDYLLGQGFEYDRLFCDSYFLHKGRSRFTKEGLAIYTGEEDNLAELKFNIDQINPSLRRRRGRELERIFRNRGVQGEITIDIEHDGFDEETMGGREESPLECDEPEACPDYSISVSGKDASSVYADAQKIREIMMRKPGK